MDASISRQLVDKMYEKRKAAALELEKQIRESHQQGERKKISQTVDQLVDMFNNPSNPLHVKNGGLIGLAGTAIALGVDVAPYMEKFIDPLLQCFTDSENRVRYFSAECLYNIAKVSKAEILVYFNPIFDALSKLAADSEISVKNGAELLDRLLKDIVAESASVYVPQVFEEGRTSNNGKGIENMGILVPHPEEEFDSIADGTPKKKAFSLARFIPLLSDRINVVSPFTRSFLVSWITVLDSVPELELISYLPDFLDGLLKYLSDPTEDVRNATEVLLGEFLQEIHDVARVQKRAEEKAAFQRDLGEGGSTEKEKPPDSDESATTERAAFLNEEDVTNSPDEEYVRKEDDADLRDTGTWLPGQGVKIDHGAIVEILIRQFAQDQDETQQAKALEWLAGFLTFAQDVTVSFTPKVINITLPNLAHHVPMIQSSAGKTNQLLFNLIQSLPVTAESPQHSGDSGKPTVGSGSSSKNAPNATPPPPPTTSSSPVPTRQATTASTTTSSSISTVPSRESSTPNTNNTNTPTISRESLADTQVEHTASPASDRTAVPHSRHRSSTVPIPHSNDVSSSFGSGISIAAFPTINEVDPAPLGLQSHTSRPHSPTSSSGVPSVTVQPPSQISSQPSHQQQQNVQQQPSQQQQPDSEPFDWLGTVHMLTVQLISEHEETRVAALKWLIMLHQKAPRKFLSANDGIFSPLLKTLSDASDDVIKYDLQLLAQMCSSTEEGYIKYFMENLLELFSTDRHLLEARGSLIVRQLCLNLNTERIYRIFAEVLEKEDDLEFASVMIQKLNIILITSPELADFRRRLKNFETRQDGQALFTTLYKSWCHNAVAVFSLCLLAQTYEHASNLLSIFADLEITVSLLVQIDKLVQLIESPVFTYIRLQLLEPEKYPHLFKCLYGLLMILPQSSAFVSLRNRLSAVNSAGFLHIAPRSSAAPFSSRSKLGRADEIKWQELLTHFRSLQLRHEKARRQALGMVTASQSELFTSSVDQGPSFKRDGPVPGAGVGVGAGGGAGVIRPAMKRRVTNEVVAGPTALGANIPVRGSGALSPLNPTRTRVTGMLGFGSTTTASGQIGARSKSPVPSQIKPRRTLGLK